MKQGVIVTLVVLGQILSTIGVVLWFAILPTMGLLSWFSLLK
ncbi:hypothetical protein CHELA1G11_10623 [Hyphomicrobiales bacterium]|nr:hypothetical protein CHELA1G11_10623 [Hyphomicrobiales bacterium]CAH1673371.1 hypothetical protein CHELA1G2_13680 [Hyphomicrobiales bacterium]